MRDYGETSYIDIGAPELPVVATGSSEMAPTTRRGLKGSLSLNPKGSAMIATVNYHSSGIL